MFGDKAEIEAKLSRFLQEVRDSDKAEGQDRVYIHGEKEAEAHERVKREGVYLNDKTYEEMRMIAEYTGASDYLPSYLDWSVYQKPLSGRTAVFIDKGIAKEKNKWYDNKKYQ